MAVLALSRTLRRFVRAVKGLKAHRVLEVVMRASVAIVEPMLVMTVVPCHTCLLDYNNRSAGALAVVFNTTGIGHILTVTDR